eukprot:6202983-Pleurochrysis_carterae.AAC.1
MRATFCNDIDSLDASFASFVLSDDDEWMGAWRSDGQPAPACLFPLLLTAEVACLFAAVRVLETDRVASSSNESKLNRNDQSARWHNCREQRATGTILNQRLRQLVIVYPIPA